jgi:hypothetical protein
MEQIKILNSTEPVYIMKQGVTRNAALANPQEATSAQKPKYKVMRIGSEIDFPKVRIFLERFLVAKVYGHKGIWMITLFTDLKAAAAASFMSH